MKLIIFALVQSTVCYQLQLPFVTPSVMPLGHFSSLSKRIPSLSTALPAAQSAVLFDCDGVIILTEELHRLAYNECWSRNELTFVEEKSGEEKPVDWSVDYYDELQNSVGGGKNKMRHYFKNTVSQWPLISGSPSSKSLDSEPPGLIDRLQDEKTKIYQEMVVKDAVARPGVIELFDEIVSNPDVKVGVCSASTKSAVETVLTTVLGAERFGKLDVFIAGDDCSEKKPSPMVYNMARDQIGVDQSNVLVIEDSLIGCKSGKAAGLKVLITYTDSTESEDFSSAGADKVLKDLTGVTLSNLIDKAGKVKIDIGETGEEKLLNLLMSI